MIQVECPRCHRTNQVERLERGAEEFCTRCDFPLFWAVLDNDAADAAFSGAGVIDPSYRRLPGTAGHLDVQGEPCRRCSEINRPDAKFCGRCGLDLQADTPLPEPEQSVVTAPAFVEVLPPESMEPHDRHVVLLLIAVVAFLLAVIFLAGILIGGVGVDIALVALVSTLAGIAVVARYRTRLFPPEKS